jgi:hypothetical protein
VFVAIGATQLMMVLKQVGPPEQIRVDHCLFSR